MRISIKVKKSEILPLIFCVLTSCYYTLKGWKYSSGMLELLLMMGVLCGLLNVFQYVLNKKRTLLLVIPFAVLIIYRMCLGADTRLFVSLVAVLVGMNIKFESIAKWIFFSKSIFLIMGLLIGGYNHLNYISMNVGVIIFLLLYLYYPEYKIKAFLIAVLIYLLGIYLSKSGAMIICAGIGIALYLLTNAKFVRNLLTCKIMTLLFPLVLFLNWLLAAIYAAYGYSDPSYNFLRQIIPDGWSSHILSYINILNLSLSGRINLAAYSMGKFGFSLWGGNIDYSVDTGLPYFLVDSGMILLLQDWGMVMAVIVMVVMVFLMWKLIQEKNYRLIISAIVIALWSFNEDTLLSVGTNYLFYVIGYELYSSRQQLVSKMKRYIDG